MTAVWPVHRFDEIDSTNDEAKRRAGQGDFGPVWLVADRQTAGRGRLGRAWSSPVGNVHATALVPVEGGVRVATRLPFAAALAAHDAVARFAPSASLELKWPNDLRSERRKLCGILVETGHQDGHLWAAIGIGMNVAFPPENAGQPATCLADLGGGATPTAGDVVNALADALPIRIVQAVDDFAATRSDWLARAEGVGGHVEVQAGDRRVEGTFCDLDVDGGMVLRLADGRRHVAHAGDVVLKREAG